MIKVLIVISIVVASAALGKYIGFTNNEGKDERGQAIVAKASHVTVGLLFLVFAIMILVVQFANMPTEMLGMLIILLLSTLIVINSISILYYSRKM